MTITEKVRLANDLIGKIEKEEKFISELTAGLSGKLSIGSAIYINGASILHRYGWGGQGKTKEIIHGIESKIELPAHHIDFFNAEIAHHQRILSKMQNSLKDIFKDHD